MRRLNKLPIPWVSSRAAVSALALAATASIVPPAYATWLATGNPVCTESHVQSSPSIVADGSSGAVIAWSDQRFGTSGDIFAQRIDSTGAVLWSANGVAVCTASGTQTTPVAQFGFDGGATIFWRDSRSTTSDIYGQRMNGQGVPLWTTNGIALSTDDNSNQFNPVAITDGGGGVTLPHGYIVAWSDQDQDASGHEGISVQHIDVNGSDLWTPAFSGGVHLCSSQLSAFAQRIATDGVGTIQSRKGAVVVWEGSRSGTSTGQDIHARRVDSSGGLNWGVNGVDVCDVAGAQHNPDIVNVGGGNVIVSWDDLRTPDKDLYAQKLNSSGAVQWLDGGLPICRATSSQSISRLAGDGAGGAIAVWTDSRSGTNRVYAQRIDGNGLPLWDTDGIPLSPASGDAQSGPSILAVAGGAIIVWIDTRNGNDDIYAQRVDANGNLLWSDSGTPVCVVPNLQSPVVAASDAAFGAVAAWVDDRDGNLDVYANRLFAGSGTVDVEPRFLGHAGLAFESANPATGVVRMRLDLPEPETVTLEVLDALGRRVRSHDAGSRLAGGTHDLVWNGADDHGHAVAAGVYFVHVEAGPTTWTKRVVELR